MSIDKCSGRLTNTGTQSSVKAGRAAQGLEGNNSDNGTFSDILSGLGSDETISTEDNTSALECAGAAQSLDLSKDNSPPPTALPANSSTPVPVIATAQYERAISGASIDTDQQGFLADGADYLPLAAATLAIEDGSLASPLAVQKQGWRATAPISSPVSTFEVADGQHSPAGRISQLGKSNNKSAAAAVADGKLDTKTLFELGKGDGRSLGERLDVLRPPVFISTDQVLEAVPVVVELFSEFRREKTSVGVSSVPIGIEVSQTLGVDAGSTVSDFLSSKSGDYANQAPGDQGPASYWISSDMKRAELQLEGLGEGPVEVSISVYGNQTQVAFRSDESQTRSMLEGRAEH